MFKSIVAATAVFASALFAHGANVSLVSKAMGGLAGDASPYTVTSLEYKAPTSSSSAPFRAQTGWYAGLKLTWSNNKQKTADTSVSVTDNANSLNQVSYSASTYNTSSGNKAPDNCGMKNSISSKWGITTGTVYYMKETEWYVCITPEILHSLSGADYSATLTIGGDDNTYTITVPHDIVLSDGSHQWYPAVGLLGDKVYGEAQYLADQISVENYTTVRFLSEPVGVTFGDGFAASDNGDGTWGVTMTHSHAWGFAVSDDGATLTATCGNAGCPVGGSTTVSLTLSGSDKVYDNKAITASDDFDSSFKTIFPDAKATISIIKDEASVETIKDAGTYTVTMTVTGLGDEPSYELTRTVTISKVDITGASLTLTPASVTYNAAEQGTTPSLKINNLTATFDVAEGSVTNATEMGAYTVTINGTGNFTGSTSGTWEIVNTTGALSGVAATTSETAGNYEDGTLTVTDTTALAYEDGVWSAGLTLTWPMDKQDSLTSGHAHYVNEESAKVVVSDGTVSNSEATAKFRKNALSGEKQFTYLSSTVWTVALSPAVVEAALTEEKTALEYTMRAGALVWGDSTEGNPDGVAFNDYTITLSLENPITFVLGEGETHDLGNTRLTTTKIKLAPGASVTSSVAQIAEGAIFIETPGYDVVWSENDGVYTYTTKFTHQHAWSFGVVDGTNLVATCANGDCDVGGATRMWLDIETTEKDYDGQSVKRIAAFDEHFMDVFPEAATVLTVNGVENGVINDAEVYTVALSVTGLGGDSEPYVLSTTVTINKKDITGAALVLSPATTTYNGKEQTVTPSVAVGGVTATLNDGLVLVEGSTCSATEIGTYLVSVNGTGNFTGSATATWSIVNTTGSLSGVTSAVSGIGDYDSENNTLTVTDSTALEYSDGAWYAGLTLTWPVEAEDYVVLGRDGYAQYVKSESMLMTIDGNEYRGNDIISGEVVYDAGKIEAKEADGSYNYRYSTGHFSYLDTTTWKVAITPAIVEAAKAESKTELAYTMNAGAFVWEDGREGDSDGVAFADYTITLPLDEPVEFVLGEGESYDLGDTVLTTTKIQLAAGASVTCDVAQAEGLIYTEVNGYDVVRTEDGGKYVYTAILTHVHDWRASVADNGYELIATCANPECAINAGEVKMWLDVGTTEKPYDGNSVTRFAVYGDGFKTVYPDSTNVVLTVNGVKDGVINNAGEYDVVLTVNGVGEETYTLSRTVTVSQVDITGAALVLTPATTTYNGAAQTVAPSVTVDGVTATLDNNGLEVSAGTCSATEIGTYSVTVNGTGNFTGTAASATWSIVNTTGTPTSVTASAAGSMTKNGNDFTLSDSSKLEYDAENEVWYAGITISWPMEKKDFEKTSWSYYAHYVTEDSVKATTEQGEIAHAKVGTSYESWNGSYNLLGDMTETKPFTYVATTTWKVPLTPAIIEAAIAEEKASLTYTMNAGAFIWGDDTEGDPDGVAFTDYTITIPLEGIKLYDGDGKQVYPKAEGQTIIEDIKDNIGDVVSDAEVAEGAKAKIDLLAGVAGEGNEQAVADWVAEVKSGYATPADFFDALAQSEYVGASFELGTTSLISDASDVEVAEFESTDGGFTLAVTIDGDDIEAARVKAARIIRCAASLDEGDFAPLDAERIEISDGGEMTVKKDANADCEFFKIMISKDSAE